ncbi:hypothetical protein [Palleronia sediminis]|uniref:hypothetical protein n=1 Tax=Palleronia sediminis TaxID=2547833 RepID=UPI0014559E62|nr:hypothetical protein [Palleronia sediminis]
MFRMTAISALLLTALAACQPANNQMNTLEPTPMTPGDTLQNPTDGFDNEIGPE